VNGFRMTCRGSRHIFTRPGVREAFNLQPAQEDRLEIPKPRGRLAYT